MSSSAPHPEGATPPMIEPDHPEAFCERCGRENIVWWAPSEVWNAVTAAVDPVKERGVIWCPTCFAALAEQHGYHVTGFEAQVALTEEGKQWPPT